MTRILFASAESLTEGYAPEAFVRGLGDALTELGHEVVVCGLDTGPYHRSTSWTRLRRYTAVCWQVMTRLGAADVVLSRGHFAHLPWALAAALRGKPVIHIMNGFIHDASTTHRMGFAVRWISDLSYRVQFRLARRVVAVTAEIAEHVSSRYRTNGVVVINNGVNTAFLRPAAVPATGRPFAIFPSSLAPWHDVQTIFEAVAKPAWPDDLDVVIVGDGPNSDSIRKSAEASPRVRFLGLQPRASLRALMQEARIGLCLVVRPDSRNISEVRPLKLFEMMACGLPVVVTDLPGQRDVVAASGGGVVIPERDPSALAAAVSDLHRRKDLAILGGRAASHASTHHSWSASAARFQQLIGEAT